MIGSVADLHFAPTALNAENLTREGIARQAVCVTGNTVVDSLLQTVSDPELLASHRWNGHLPGDGRIVLVTTHRRESWMPHPAGGEDQRPLALEEILLAIRDSLEQHPSVDFVFTVHPNPRVREPVRQILGERANLHLTDPLPYLSFVELMTRSTVVLTDSGGIQEEAPSLGLPVLVIRQKTERTEALELLANKLVGTSREKITAELQRCLAAPQRRPSSLPLPNPFGDGQASRRIVAAVLAYFGLGDRMPEFEPAEITPAVRG
jgi:UDP-N-acetylglucosamine 2-epimerase (non-hydrolysing)